MARLNGRLSEYNQKSAALDPALVKTLQITQPTGPQAAIQEAYEKIVEAAEVHGRAATLSKFLNEAAASGQIGNMAAWLENQAGDWTRDTNKEGAVETKLREDIRTNPRDRGLGPRVFNALIAHGWEQGQAAELLALTNDVQGYARDYGGASTLDERREEERSRELQSYLSAPRVNVQAPIYANPFIPAIPGAPVTTNCFPFGSMVHCTTQ